MRRRHITRRTFLQQGAAGLLASAIQPGLARAQGSRAVAGNQWPGRIVICRDRLMSTVGQVDPQRVEMVLSACLCELAEATTPTEALETLLPGFSPTSKIAVKVNCIAQCATRWEVAWALCSCLSKLCDSTYDMEQVTIFDQNYLAGAGYTEAAFTFGGSAAQLSDSPPFGSGVYPVPGHEITSVIAEADFLVDMPVLKDHNDNELTLSLKNHYGSVDPQSGMCGDFDTMLALNAHQSIKDKTALVILDGLFGVWQGGPGVPPQYWSTYGDGTPNTLLVSTDPVTVDYWGRDTINRERAHHGLQAYEAQYIEEASLPPYELGVSDPAHMDVRSLHLGAEDSPGHSPTALTLPPYPNPTTGPTMLRFRLDHEADVRISVHTLTGRRVALLASERFGPGEHCTHWDGRDLQGRQLGPGVYRWLLEGDGWRTAGSVLVVR